MRAWIRRQPSHRISSTASILGRRRTFSPVGSFRSPVAGAEHPEPPAAPSAVFVAKYRPTRDARVGLCGYGLGTMNSPSSPAIGILANPMSGRDVRRLVARAGHQTIEAKRSAIARIAVGAAAAGVRRIVILREPLRVSTGALESLAVPLDIEVLDVASRLDASDTTEAARGMREAGCGAVVVLGGDGTNRIFAKAWPTARIIPVSTGTNNVFPRLIEPTLAGAAAGLVALGVVDPSLVAPRCKTVRVTLSDARNHPELSDLALVDAALLVDDQPGNLMPFEPGKLRTLVLTRAEPAAIGTSPIGGLLEPAGANDNFGVLVHCTGHDGGGKPLLVPISPGLYRPVHVAGARRLALGEVVEIEGPGLLALDGDRMHVLAEGEIARLEVRRDGPQVIDVELALTLAARSGHFLGRTLEDRSGGLPGCC